MSDNYKDKIQEIRSRRSSKSAYQPPMSGQMGGGAYDPNPSVGINGVGGVGGAGRAGQATGVNQVSIGQQHQQTESLFGPDFKSPWLRDRVTLSLEGQIAMMEFRSVSKTNSVDLGYTNRIPILPIRPGIFVKVEPPGTYRLVYNYR